MHHERGKSSPEYPVESQEAAFSRKVRRESLCSPSLSPVSVNADCSRISESAGDDRLVRLVKMQNRVRTRKRALLGGCKMNKSRSDDDDDESTSPLRAASSRNSERRGVIDGDDRSGNQDECTGR